MKKFLKMLWWTLVVLFVGIQFFPPVKNKGAVDSEKTIAQSFNVPADVKQTLEKSCYDCHSNNTKYPWYTYVQPVGWWMHEHIDDGKEELNFDEFATYSPRRQFRKFAGIKEEVKEGEMPLPSYTLIHRDAILSVGEADALYAWCDAMRKEMQLKFPPDSLKKK